MKGDTLEYNTEHLKMRHNAVVEDLLRRLPGLRVDPDGTIWYNGEKIQHLLVDGEEFFQTDPTLITRNFDAAKIARIQLLDRKSEKAVFTGVDDGSRTKTINLVIKEGVKNGYSGSTSAGGNPSGYYSNKVFVVGLRNKEQVGVLGLTDNTGAAGSSGNGSGSGPLILPDNGTDALGASAGTGIPRTNGSAVHYANRWNETGSHLSGDYLIGSLWKHPITTTLTSQILPEGIYKQDQSEQSWNRETMHRIMGVFDGVLSPRSAFQLRIDGGISSAENQFKALTNTRLNDALENSELRTIRDQSNKQTFNSSLSWRIQPGKKTGQLISVIVAAQSSNSKTNGYLYSLDQSFQPDGSSARKDTVDEWKRITDHGLRATGTVFYIQPLFAGAVLGCSYSLAMQNQNTIQYSFGRNGDKYDHLIDSLTTVAQTQTFVQGTTVNIQGKTQYINYTLGILGTDYRSRQEDLQKDSAARLHYINWSPKLLLNYTPNSHFNLKVEYRIETILPTADQMMPIKNNNSPLSVNLGNPDLKPSTRQLLEFRFNWLKKWMIALDLRANINNGSISTKTITDSFGRQVSQPVNVAGGGLIALAASINRSMGGIDWGLSGTNTYSRTINFVNADLVRTDLYVNGLEVNAKKYLAERLSFQISTSFSYTASQTSVTESPNLHYWSQFHALSATFYPMPKYEFGTSAKYEWQQSVKTLSGATSIILWNAYASRSFLNDRLILRVQINNILDQNSGIDRVNTGNTSTQTAKNILGRVWMLSATYHFDRRLKGRKESTGM